ncbi:MAG: hypothetical protein H6737_05440 [Alphaproteobacteria bacterium]|nr:hypothetical protein [Alphaproteobacteria bacterium]
MSGFSQSRPRALAQTQGSGKRVGVPSALTQANQPAQKKAGGGGSWLGTALDKGDKLTSAFDKGLSFLYGDRFKAPGRLDGLGKMAKPLGGAFGMVNGVRDLFDSSKSGTEKTKSALGIYSGAKDILGTKTGQAALGKAKDIGSSIANSKLGQKVGQGAGGLWNSIKSGASGLGSKIMGSKLAQGIAGSKLGKGAANLAGKAGGLLDRSAGWGASKLNKVADFGGGLLSKVKGSKAIGALDGVMGKVGKRFGGEALEQGAKALAKTGGKEVLEAGGKAAAKGGMKALGKAGSRFVPGMNVAIAALDAKHAWDTIRDPNAPMHKKLTSGITALGSGLAATNIPVLSQIGAGVSTVSSLVEAVGPENIGKAAQWAGGKIKDGAQWAGGKIKDGAQWAGGKIKDGAGWVGNKAKDLGKAAWGGAKKLGGAALNKGKELVGGAKNLAKGAWNGVKSAGGAIKSGAKSLWNGGKSLASGAAKKVGNVAGKVGSGIKKVFSGW